MNEMKKKIILPVMVGLLMVLATVGVTYAFFNYTRTGSSNTVRTGTINFTSSQAGTFNLTNVFPIATGDVLSDNNNSSEVVITVSGDTTYTQGIEYLVTLEDVNVRTNTYKKVPVGLMVTPEKTGELGTSDNAYFTNRGGETSIYKSFIGESDILEDGQYVLVGYIRPGEAEVNGTIGIRAFIDKDSIAITDTPEENTEWQNGRMVLSTSEWNSLQTNGISFKVRVVANEGVWVGEPTSRNDMKNVLGGTTVLTSSQKSNITEINFIRMSEEMINTHANLIDLTADSGQGVVKGWIENNKLYIASPGVTYFPVDSSGLFNGFSGVTNINFNNIDTSVVTNMAGFFSDCRNLTNLDLSNFDMHNVQMMNSMFVFCNSLINLDLSSLNTTSVTNMSTMFMECSNLISVDLSGLGGNNLMGIGDMFSGCTNLKEINMQFFNFGTAFLRGTNGSPFYNLSSVEKINLSNAVTTNVNYMELMFSGCSSLTTLDISSFDTGKVTSMGGMFNGCTSLTTIYVGNNWDTSKLTSSTSSTDMFKDCTLLVGGNGTVYDSTIVDKTRAVIDTPSTPGYLTMKQV